MPSHESVMPTSPPTVAADPYAHPLRHNLVIGLTAFLTLVDLFATQAILPTLAAHFAVSPGAMGTAVNASTLGMAVSGLLVALFSHHIDRRQGVLVSLIVLAIPTTLLASAPDLASFALLRVAQGVCMAAAFTLTLAYLGEHEDMAHAAGAFAAYVTGNVASNLVGRMVSAGLADQIGLAGNFYAFALLNLAGAALVWRTMARGPGRSRAAGRASMPIAAGRASMPIAAGRAPMATAAGWRTNLRSATLRRCFALGFCILFAFIGTFTYVNFALIGPPYLLSPMLLGSVYLVFVPAMVTTPLAGRVVGRFGPAVTLLGGLVVALVGLPLLLLPTLPALLAGLILVAAGTFMAQAVATGIVARSAVGDSGSATGIYLASYFTGGLVGSAALGAVFTAYGWQGCVAGIGLALLVALWLGWGLRENLPQRRAD